MKRVLVVYYSQSGDVHAALDALTQPLHSPEVEIIRWRLESVPPYPFPWSVQAFFDCMPEAVNGEPPALAPLRFDPAERFDLVLIGWQVWFLSPSLPIQAFFATPHAQVLRGTRVITVACCRQMWQRAHARIRALVSASGGVHTDSIVVTHQGPAMATYLTAPLLMLTGRRDRLAFLPPPGVAPAEIENLGGFGRRLRETTDRWAAAPPTPLLTGLDAVKVNVAALMPELIGAGAMVLLARIARRCGKPGSLLRRPVIWLFVLLLVLLLPVVLTASVVLTPVLRRLFAGRLTTYLRTVQG